MAFNGSVCLFDVKLVKLTAAESAKNGEEKLTTTVHFLSSTIHHISHLISYPKRFKDLRNMYWVYPPQYHSTSLFTLTGRVMHSIVCNPYTEHL